MNEVRSNMLTRPVLEDACRKAGLPTTGSTGELARRINDFDADSGTPLVVCGLCGSRYASRRPRCPACGFGAMDGAAPVPVSAPIETALGTIDIARIDAATFDAECARLGIDGIPGRIDRRVVVYAKIVAATAFEIADCGKCGHGSDARATRCPWCGNAFASDVPAKVTSSSQAAPAAAKAKGGKVAKQGGAL